MNRRGGKRREVLTIHQRKRPKYCGKAACVRRAHTGRFNAPIDRALPGRCDSVGRSLAESTETRMTRKAGKRKKLGSRARCVVDDSPKAIQARLDTFVGRTRGWGRQAAHAQLPDNIFVLAGPTRKTRSMSSGVSIPLRLWRSPHPGPIASKETRHEPLEIRQRQSMWSVSKRYCRPECRCAFQ